MPIKAFLIARAEAIGHFARMEQAFAALFATLTGMREHEAGIVFFKINNVRSLVDMLDSLKKKRHGTQYNLFFNATMKSIKIIANTRNGIVHWNAVCNISADDGKLQNLSDIEAQVFTYNLHKPNIWEFFDVS